MTAKKSHDDDKEAEKTNPKAAASPSHASSILADLQDLESAVASSNWNTASQDVINLLQKVHDLTFGSGEGMHATKLEGVDKTELTRCCDSIRAKCSVHQAKAVPSAAGEVGKFDPSKLVGVIIQILPLILGLFS